jgi:hypothetical protein
VYVAPLVVAPTAHALDAELADTPSSAPAAVKPALTAGLALAAAAAEAEATAPLVASDAPSAVAAAANRTLRMATPGMKDPVCPREKVSRNLYTNGAFGASCCYRDDGWTGK